MNTLCPTFVGIFLIGSLASAQSVLYSEDFVGHPGGDGLPISGTGWVNDIHQENVRWYATPEAPEGAVWSWGFRAYTEAFYTTVDLDDGDTGMAFPSIDVDALGDLEFSVDLSSNYQPENASAYFAVEMGDSWYVSTTSLDGVGEAWEKHSMIFDVTAAKWNTLAVTGIGSLDVDGASVGGAAGSDLSGLITGAGLVVVRTGSGTIAFDNFSIGFAAVPEPRTIASLLALSSLLGVLFRRKR